MSYNCFTAKQILFPQKVYFLYPKKYHPSILVGSNVIALRSRHNCYVAMLEMLLIKEAWNFLLVDQCSLPSHFLCLNKNSTRSSSWNFILWPLPHAFKLGRSWVSRRGPFRETWLGPRYLYFLFKYVKHCSNLFNNPIVNYNPNRCVCHPKVLSGVKNFPCLFLLYISAISPRSLLSAYFSSSFWKADLMAVSLVIPP